MPLNSYTRLSFLNQTELPAETSQFLKWLELAKTTIEENETAITQLLVEKQNLINDLENCQQEINALANSNLKSEQKIKEFHNLIQELETKEQQNQELNQVNQFLENKLKQLSNKQEQESTKNQQTISELQEIIQEKEELITNLRQKLSELHKKQQQSRQSKQDLEKQITLLFSNQSQTQIQISRQLGQINYLKNKNTQLNQFQEQLLIEIEQEKQKVSNLTSQLKNNSSSREELLKSELEQTAEKLDRAEKELFGKETEISKLGQKLSESQAYFQKLGQKFKEWNGEDYQSLSDQFQFISQQFEEDLTKKTNLLAQMDQELLKSNQKYLDLLKQVEGTPQNSWQKKAGKLGKIGLIVGLIIGIVILIKKKIG